jgi:hypothetical protein
MITNNSKLIFGGTSYDSIKHGFFQSVAVYAVHSRIAALLQQPNLIAGVP